MKLKNYKSFPALINDKKQLEQAIDDFGCNICKGSKRLKQDKDLVIQAINKDATTALYLDENQKKDPDIRRAVELKDKEITEFIDPISELAKDKNPDELNLLVQARNKILFAYLNKEEDKSVNRTPAAPVRNRQIEGLELGG